MTKKKKLLILIACECVLLFTMVTGTIAWLTAESGTITNTFKPSNIEVALEEYGANNNVQAFQMVPGATIDKKATVSVENDVDCYVFVKVVETTNLDTYITYNMADGWLALPNNDGVYYRVVAANAETKTWSVLKDNAVTVNGGVTKEQMNALGTDTANYPKLTFTAYAIQKDYLSDGSAAVTTPEGAWTILKAGN